MMSFAVGKIVLCFRGGDRLGDWTYPGHGKSGIRGRILVAETMIKRDRGELIVTVLQDTAMGNIFAASENNTGTVLPNNHTSVHYCDSSSNSGSRSTPS